MPEEKSEKRTIEAALFMSGRELSFEEMRRLTGIAAFGYLQRLAEELKKEYMEKGSALEVYETGGKYGMRVRENYIDAVKQFAQDTEISKSSLRTLAYIAKHDGVLKSELVKRMGVQVYQTVKELAVSEFVKPQKAGRSSKLFVTEKFRRYFKVVDVPVSQAAKEAISGMENTLQREQSETTLHSVPVTDEGKENEEMGK